MNILIVSHYFWPEAFRINDLALALKERGHQITVLTGMPNYPEGKFFEGYSFCRHAFREEMWEGICIVRAPLIPRGKGGMQLLLNYFSLLVTGSLAGPLLCRGKYDLIFVFQQSPVTIAFSAILMKILTGTPILMWIQDIWPETLEAVNVLKSRSLLRCVEFMVRIIYRNCDRILIQSKAFFSCVKRAGIPDHRIVFFPNTAENFYQPVCLEPDAPEHQYFPKGFRIVFAGNIGAAQDFPTILSAADRLRKYTDIHWVIIGDGRARREAEAMIIEKGLQSCVHFIGRFPPEEMPRFFALADALLVTLKREPIFALTIPSKVQSYLACNRPILAALDGEGRKVIEESGAGLVCAPENPEGLAEIAFTLYQLSPTERARLGDNGRRYFEAHFGREMLLDQLETIFKKVTT